MRKSFYLIGLILAISCGNKSSKVDEQVFINLGNEKQYVEMTGASSNDPILLFIHGGPGWPQTPHLRFYNSGLTKDLILVTWDQRGCGRSFMNDSTPKNLSLEQIVSDAHELTEILKKKFHKDKIYLAGFSWGSIIGLHLIEKYSEDYIAYFGISQVINVRQEIKLSRDWIREQATKNNDTSTLKVLSQLDNGDTSLCKNELECFLNQFEQLSKYHGAIHDPAIEKQLDIVITKYDDYKNYDWMGGFMYSASRLGNDLFNCDLSRIKELKVPVYFFVGRHDHNVVTSITKEFENNLKAPKKEIVWFENSGHEPLEEEAGKFNAEILSHIKK